VDARRLSRRPARDDEGFTLVEVLVSVLVFTVALLGLAAVQTRALSSVVLSEERQQATGYANALLELARAYTADADQFAEARAHALDDPAEPFHLVPETVASVIAGSDSGTEYTTFVYLTPARRLDGTKISDDLLDVRAEVSWTSRNGGGAQRQVVLRTQVSAPRSGS